MDKLLSTVSALALKPGVVFMDAPTLESLQERYNGLEADAAAIVAKADGENRDLNEEELKEIETKAQERDNLKRQIEARKLAAPPAPTPGSNRRTTPEPRRPSDGSPQRVEARPNDPRAGFRNLGEFARTVRQATLGQVDALTRITNAQTTYAGEGTGADGGFAVPPEFRQAIWVKVQSEDSLLSRTTQIQIAGNNITIPKDEVAPWDTSNGVQVYWEPEATAPTVSKPKFGLETIRLGKLMALVPVSEELLEDAPGLDSWLRAKVPGKMVAKLNEAIINGDGNGKPLGILQAGSFITVASAGTNQSADTVVYENIIKTYSAMYGPCRANAVWLVNPDAEESLYKMKFDINNTTTSVPVYLPAGGASVGPYGTLMGRPVIPLQACSTVGDIGDVILVDLSQYFSITKGDTRTDVSMHLYFDQALLAYRFIFRVNGLPSWGSSISPAHGSLSQSWAVGPGTR